MPPFLLLLLTVATYAQTSLHDERDGKTYKTAKIGTQIWTAENLNYNAEGSVCYENKPENCEKYGRLYNWETAMKSCPKGWHLPSGEEWQVLVDLAGGDEVAGKKLKAKSGWNNYKDKFGNGTDEFGFSAIPGGDGSSDSYFRYVGDLGSWWGSSEYENNSYDAYSRLMGHYGSNVYKHYLSKTFLFSVRCVKD